ncbi:MAG: CDP-diacylglycerol--glycerol-3-phosphate 3-phosphatidyltransferase [Gammaproteobacteria bacterium]|nr:CDP-diacylglycerol--glycerol-3-phosphate 3-phosphatidyltransferase [Gammaproteobacteria bacterium]
MKLTIPTAITVFRIILIPVFVIVFYLPIEQANIYAAIIFAIAGVSDWADGYLARVLNQQSSFGAFLDPVADKLMVSVAIILILQSHPTVWMAIPSAIIISREITVSALREWMAELGLSSSVKVSMVGKIKTSAQMLSIFLILVEESFYEIPVLTIGQTLYYVAATLTLYSMYLYLVAAIPAFKKNS